MQATELAEFATADVFDSRDVIARIEELEDQGAENDLGEEEAVELLALVAFASEAEGYCPDWRYGEAFIADSYFEDYARQLADDIGAVDSNASWPTSYIDWPAAARALQMDYSAVELAGRTFWTR